MTLNVRLLSVLSVLAAPVLASAATPLTIYSGNVRPADEAWLYATQAPPPALPPTAWAGATEALLGGGSGVRLNTLADLGGYAGYFKQLPTNTLSRSIGFQASFTLNLHSEVNTAGQPRAGLSILVLTTDPQAIELAFQKDRIFAQPAGFAAFGESASVNLDGEFTAHIRVFGGTYALHLNDSASPVLTGSLRNYSGTPTPFGFIYDNRDAIFLGDDTTRAAADFTFSRATVIPEPAISLVALASLPVILRRRR
jgi:hypothetical protein